jgi:hypothetical protein
MMPAAVLQSYFEPRHRIQCGTIHSSLLTAAGRGLIDLPVPTGRHHLKCPFAWVGLITNVSDIVSEEYKLRSSWMPEER